MGYLKDALKQNTWRPNKPKDDKNNDHWEPCPRCQSNRVHKVGFWYIFFIGLALLGISIWLLIIPPVGIVGIIVGLAIMIISPFGSKQLQCKDCNKVWKPTKKEQS